MSASTRQLASALLVISVLALSAGCERSRLTDAAGRLTFVPEHVDLGEAVTGTSASAELAVVNGGRAPLEVIWEIPADPWEVSGLPASVPAGEVRLRITFHAREPGPSEAVLKAHVGDRMASATLSARSVRLPDCPTPTPCHASAFDVVLGRCVESELPDGTACDPHNLCLTEAACHAGRCTGTPVVCDDGNACTVDSCNPLNGCESQPGPPCPGDGKCRVGRCDPKIGCGLALAEDGTVCGARGCDAAEICIAGECVVRDPPDGFVCDLGSPCREPGICRGSACVQADATPLSPKWSLDSGAAPDTTHWLHDFVLEPSGEMSLMGFFSHPSLRANGPSPVDLAATARRCILWNGRLACADFGNPQINGEVALVDLASAARLWSFSLAAARPDFAAESRVLFMARVAAVSTDRLGALFEAYPSGSTGVTECRAYYLVMLDAGGAMVAATRVSDPFLSV
ncbi:MAG TPA: tenascin-X, partial [Myxococcaceae bacterium]|nr:tenascin-X [Myxococcaceae bacterium]